MTKLSNSWQIKSGISIKNHFVMAPMVNQQSEEDGCLGEDEFQWLRERAKGGYGMIITTACNVSKTGKTWSQQLSIYDDKHLLGLTKLASELKLFGAKPLVQIFHGGARCPSSITGVQPVSASAFFLDLANFEQPRALSEPEIKQIVAEFIAGAKRAHFAGFAGVEIHGANGYLLCQFISPDTNQRSDNYGGSLENRARLIREILQGCKQELPSDFIVGVRLSPENRGIQTGLDLDESIQIAKWLVEDGADYIHLSTNDMFKSADKYPTQAKALISYFIDAVGQKVPLLAAGGLQTLEQMQAALELGLSGVALGRAAIANADLPLHLDDSSYQLLQPPYTWEQLKSVKVSQFFYKQLKNYPGMIAESK